MGNIGSIDKRLKVETKIFLPETDFYNAAEAPFGLYGAAAREEHDTPYKRMPAEAAEAVSDGVMRLYRHTAGIRLRFSTDSPFIAIRVRQPACEKMPHMTLLGQAGFDLYDDTYGSFYTNSFLPPPDSEGGYEAAVFPGSKGIRSYTLNFPLYCEVTELYIGLASGAVLKEGMPYAPQPPILYYGSSITQGGCASRPGNAYQSIIARQNGIDFRNLGFSGNARGETAIARYLAQQPMSAFVCDYDHNAESAQALGKTHEQLYRLVREQNANLPIVLVTKPDFKHGTEDAKRRAVIQKTYWNGVRGGDKNLWYVDGAQLFDAAYADCSTVDGCHPNDFGFVSMAKTIGATLRNALAAAQSMAENTN